MANPVVNNSLIKCSMACSLPPGTPVPRAPSYPTGLPANFIVPPKNRVMSGNQPIANVMDINILPFQMSCQSQTNSAVVVASAQATAAALGTPMFVPAPCTPTISGPWTFKCPKCQLGKNTVLDNTCKLFCTMGGTIEIVNTSAMMVNVPER